MKAFLIVLCASLIGAARGQCNAGQGYSAYSGCYACYKGYYQNVDNHYSSCKVCPTGKITQNEGSISENQCTVECSSGLYRGNSNDGGRECKSCPEGYASDTASDSCTQCASGTYTSETGH